MSPRNPQPRLAGVRRLARATRLSGSVTGTGEENTLPLSPQLMALGRAMATWQDLHATRAAAAQLFVEVVAREAAALTELAIAAAREDQAGEVAATRTVVAVGAEMAAACRVLLDVLGVEEGLAQSLSAVRPAPMGDAAEAMLAAARAVADAGVTS